MKTNSNTSRLKDFYSNLKRPLLIIIVTGCIAFATMTEPEMFQHSDIENSFVPQTRPMATMVNFNVTDRIIHHEDFEKIPSISDVKSLWKINHFNKNCKKSRNGHWARLVRAGGYIYGPQLDFYAEKDVQAYEYSGWFNTPEGYTNGKIILQILNHKNITIHHESVAVESTQGEWKQMKMFMNIMKIRQQQGIASDEPVRINVSIRNEDNNHPLVIDDLKMTPSTLKSI